MIKKTIKISILLGVLAALSFISCKTQPTAVSDFQVIEEIPNTTPTPTDTNGSTNINITIDNSKGLSQFAVSHYKSGNYSVNGNVAYYYATVSNNCIIVGAKYTNGTVLEENANMYLTDSSQTGATYSLKGTRFSQQNVNTATATFTEDGYLIIKFSNVSSEIRYSLQPKYKSSLVVSVPTASGVKSNLTNDYKIGEGHLTRIALELEGMTEEEANVFGMAPKSVYYYWQHIQLNKGTTYDTIFYVYSIYYPLGSFGALNSEPLYSLGSDSVVGSGETNCYINGIDYHIKEYVEVNLNTGKTYHIIGKSMTENGQTKAFKATYVIDSFQVRKY